MEKVNTTPIEESKEHVVATLIEASGEFANKYGMRITRCFMTGHDNQGQFEAVVCATNEAPTVDHVLVGKVAHAWVFKRYLAKWEEFAQTMRAQKQEQP
jgi:hypothetical protein